MTTKQLIELLSQFDPETTVQVAFPTGAWDTTRGTLGDIQVVQLDRYNGVHPLISVGFAHLLED